MPYLILLFFFPLAAYTQQPAPIITHITPATLAPKEAGKRQWITIHGQYFGDDARLELQVEEGRTFSGRVPLSFSATQLRYKINTGTLERTWTVRVKSHGQWSNAYPVAVRKATTAVTQPNHVTTSQVSLAHCDRLFRQLRLTLGTNQTASRCYRTLLEDNPNSLKAQFGLEKIEIYYFARIKAALDRQAWSEAETYRQRLYKMNPNSLYFAALSAASTQNEPTEVVDNTSSVTGQAHPITPYYELIKQAAQTYNIPIAFIQSVIEVESSFDPNATSDVGAQGLMQIMPDTAERFDVENAYDPEENIQAGVAYLRQLWDMYDGNLELVLAAYHSGEGNVRHYGNTVPPSTRSYVERVLTSYRTRQE